jgi:hypothetical protein
MADVFTVLGQDHQEVKRMLAELENGPTKATGAIEDRVSSPCTRPLRLGPGSVPTRDQAIVPAQHRLRPYQQPQPMQHLWPQTVQQRRQDRSVGCGEPHLLPAQLAFQHGDLMT